MCCQVGSLVSICILSEVARNQRNHSDTGISQTMNLYFPTHQQKEMEEGLFSCHQSTSQAVRTAALPARPTTRKANLPNRNGTSRALLLSRGGCWDSHFFWLSGHWLVCLLCWALMLGTTTGHFCCMSWKEPPSP